MKVACNDKAGQPLRDPRILSNSILYWGVTTYMDWYKSKRRVLHQMTKFVNGCSHVWVFFPVKVLFSGLSGLFLYIVSTRVVNGDHHFINANPSMLFYLSTQSAFRPIINLPFLRTSCFYLNVWMNWQHLCLYLKLLVKCHPFYVSQLLTLKGYLDFPR